MCNTDAKEVQYNLCDRKQLHQPAIYDDFAMFVCEPDLYTAAVNSDNAREWERVQWVLRCKRYMRTIHWSL